jgi:putative peptide zinc metalloprotease protein
MVAFFLERHRIAPGSRPCFSGLMSVAAVAMTRKPSATLRRSEAKTPWRRFSARRDVHAMRGCGRPGCNAPAAAAMGFNRARQAVWLRPLDEPEATVRLCRAHADSLRPPRGWQFFDYREPTTPDPDVEPSNRPPAVELPLNRPGAVAYPSARSVPRLCGACEFLGEYRGSGYTTPQFLVRRDDGRMVQLTGLLYALVEQIDGRRGSASIAGALSDRLDREITDENVAYLVANKLEPLGIATFDPKDADSRTAPDLLLRLRAKWVILPARVVRPLAGGFRHLFHLPIVLAIVALFLYVDVWLLMSGQLSTGARDLLRHPAHALVVVLVVYAGALFHELGHAGACAFGGATPGAIGGGFYVLFPALYTDVGDSYRLSRTGRVRTDLGGVYFNALLAVALFLGYLLTGFLPLVVAAAAMNVLIAHQLLPFMRFDGYWVASDLAGVPDLFAYLGAALRRVLRPRCSIAALSQLKPATRRIVVGWAATTIVVLAWQFALLLFLGPAIARALLESGWIQLGYARTELRDGAVVGVLLGALNALLAILLFAGIVFAFVLLTARAVGTVSRRWGRTTLRRSVTVGLLLAVLAAPVTFSAVRIGSALTDFGGTAPAPRGRVQPGGPGQLREPVEFPRRPARVPPPPAELPPSAVR